MTTESTKRLKTTALHLSCKLTEDERNARARDLVAELEAKHETEQRHKETKASQKVEIGEHDGRISKLSAAARTGFETQLVTCDEVAHYDAGVVVTVRRDTGEEVATRKLAESERQVAAFEEGDGDEEALVAAFEAGQASESGANPYPEGTTKAAEFDRGYRSAAGAAASDPDTDW